MDISDILGGLSAPDESQSSSQTLQQLTRAFALERLAPELLPYPHALLRSATRSISARIAEIEELESNPAGGGGLKSVILQMDLERWKWLVRAFLRVRLAKLAKFGRYYLSITAEDAEAADPSEPSSSLLHPSERAFLAAHQGLLADHYTASFLTGFPQALRGLDDTVGGASMLDTPDLKKAVFVRVLKAGDGKVSGTSGDRWHEGDVWVLRYENVREAVTDREVELI